MFKCTDLLGFEGLPSLMSGSVNVIVTSPPYNRNIKYKGYEDKLSQEAYKQWVLDWMKELNRVMAVNGSFFLNVGSCGSDPLFSLKILTWAMRFFMLQNRFVWVKSISLEDGSRGHFRPIPGDKHVHNMFEDIFQLTHTGDVKLYRTAIGVPFQDKSNIERFGHADDLRCRGNVWYIPYKTRQKEGEHPAGFPIQLPMMCIKLVRDRPGVVLDPFAGEGTTLKAAEELGHEAVGFEIEKSYVESYNGHNSRH